MEVVNTMEISGEEREIADAVAREQCAANAEGIDGLNNNLSVIGKCKNLLNPTLATTTENGVTCTNNGDGTFTLNGTATAITQFKLMDLNKAYAKKVKLLGTPKNGGNTNFYVYFITSDGIRSDLNNGRFIDSNITINNLCLWVNNGIVCKNVIFKPMLTTNLNATYDDFVPYTGDGDTLTADVAELKSDLSEKLKVISVSLSDVMVSAMSSTTVDLPQEYIDAGYVIANILSKPDTGLNYTTGSETSIIIRNNTDSAVAFAPTTTVKVLIAKIG